MTQAERQERRLLIAGRLMEPQAFTATEAKRRIGAMPPADRAHLQGLTDWVEAYDDEGQRMALK